MRHFYFAYGMNTNPNEMARRCPGSKPVGPAFLQGYKFVFRGHADVELADDHEYVHGMLWEIDDFDLEALDALEGFPEYYLRQRVKVMHDSEEHVAWVYTMQDQSFEAGPTERYFTMCKEGYQYYEVDTDQLFDALKYDEKEIF